MVNRKAKVKQLHFMVSKEEFEKIKENAEKAQLTVSEYLRTLAIYGEVK